MKHAVIRSLFVALLVAASNALGAPSTRPASGLWDAGVVVSGVIVPFRFELSTKDGQASGAFFNGTELVRSTSGHFEGSALSLRFDQYASTLQAEWRNGALIGSYARAGQAGYAFQASPHLASPPFTGAVPTISGEWEIPVQSAKGEQAWRFFIRQSGPNVSASILRVDGDTGTLEGSFRGGKFLLSHFSGARPLLLEATLLADGTLSLLQNGKVSHTAFKRSEARAKNLPEPADPSRWTSVRDPSQPLRFSGVDLEGKVVTESDARFKGKVVLVNVMGSWCPNCHDEAPFLEELYRAYRARGLQVVSLSFEDSEQLENPLRLRAFVKAYGLDYMVLLAGEPGEVGQKLPQATNLNTWPATFFVGRDGLVHGAHAGFAGKATGKAHEQLKAELREKIEKLLSDKI